MKITPGGAGVIGCQNRTFTVTAVTANNDIV